MYRIYTVRDIRYNGMRLGTVGVGGKRGRVCSRIRCRTALWCCVVSPVTIDRVSLRGRSRILVRARRGEEGGGVLAMMYHVCQILLMGSWLLLSFFIFHIFFLNFSTRSAYR